MFLNYCLLVDRNIFVHLSQHYNRLFLQFEENIACNLVDDHYFQMIKQKDYLLLENLDQLSKINMGFGVELLFLIDICSS